jgi:7-cyano-7-deazaguanine reductase
MSAERSERTDDRATARELGVDRVGERSPLQLRELTVLGHTVREPIEHVEVFAAPAHVTTVRFTTDEVASLCPVTRQPDLSHVVIEYVPGEWCIESKSLKLYLWGFRDRPVFAEALAAEIAAEVMTTAQPKSVAVTLTQRPRGGIEVSVVARRER